MSILLHNNTILFCTNDHPLMLLGDNDNIPHLKTECETFVTRFTITQRFSLEIIFDVAAVCKRNFKQLCSVKELKLHKYINKTFVLRQAICVLATASVARFF